ncbi:hypothetical protein [Glutamicibacter sp. AOP3-A1-12]|uniref:hypothetical protein n=1 Tax=Glutamicibacter sp. AOP3-A1-12 TaxID=3457701 RepID=UPI0040348273
MSEKTLQGRSRFEVSSILKSLSGEYDLIREHQKSLALTSAIDYRTRALFAAMKANENDTQSPCKEELDIINRSLSQLAQNASAQESRTRRIFAQTSDIHSVSSAKEELSMLTDLREQMVAYNSSISSALGPAFYGISNRLHEVERNLEDLVNVSQVASISQWQVNHRTLLGGMELMRIAGAFQDYLRSSEEILALKNELKLPAATHVICGGLSEFTLFYVTRAAMNHHEAWILCRNVLEQEFLMGLIKHLPKSIHIVPLLKDEVYDLLQASDDGLGIREKIESLGINEIISISSGELETLRS